MDDSHISAPLGHQPLTETKEIPAFFPPGPPDGPGVRLPPVQGPIPRTEPSPDLSGSVPVTDGTPLPCHQKNAREFLQGRSPGVMAQYAPGLFSTEQHTHSAHPAPENDVQAVKSLVEWREEAPYG